MHTPEPPWQKPAHSHTNVHVQGEGLGDVQVDYHGCILKNMNATVTVNTTNNHYHTAEDTVKGTNRVTHLNFAYWPLLFSHIWNFIVWNIVVLHTIYGQIGMFIFEK